MQLAGGLRAQRTQSGSAEKGETLRRTVEPICAPITRRRPALLAAALLAAIVAVGASGALVVPKLDSVVTTKLPTPSAGPLGIVSGPDGNLWFTEGQGEAIGTLKPKGIYEFHLFASLQGPGPIVAGKDGNLWFTLSQGSSIGRITPAGDIKSYPTPTAGSAPAGITLDHDGNVWFTEPGANQIGEINMSTNTTTEYPIPTASAQPGAIALGHDGALWFTEGANKIGWVTQQGAFKEFPIPTTASNPAGIALGADGAMWFTEQNADKIGRITTDGAISEFPIPTAESKPYGIVPSPDGDGSLWFTEQAAGKIGNVTPDGKVTEFALAPGTAPTGITVGPDKNIWFTERDGNALGKLWTAAGIAAYTKRYSISVHIRSAKTAHLGATTPPQLVVYAQAPYPARCTLTLVQAGPTGVAVALWTKVIQAGPTTIVLPLPGAARKPGDYLLVLRQQNTYGTESVPVTLKAGKS
jgi:virginiamycin B lyase